MSQELSQSSVPGQMNDDLAIGHSGRLAYCALCHRFLSSDDVAGDLEAISICGDCKFLLLEDLGTPIQDEYRRRTHGLRIRRYSSSDSFENLFSEQFSHMINQARQNQAAVSEHDSLSIDGDVANMVVQRSSSRTTPSGSRRWRTTLSDTESDVFDSFYGDSESNVSFSGSRFFHGESDTISYSAYGGDSDASADGHSFLENENYPHQDGLSDPETDTDIDPMNAGLHHWNLDEPEEDNEDEEDVEWEETDAEDNSVATVEHGAQLHRSFNSFESNVTSIWRRFEGRETLRYTPNLVPNSEEAQLQNYAGNLRDYSGARGFEELLENLAETESSRRGAPPASVSFVDNLPHVIIREDHEKLDGSACAICKDSLSVGTVVNQLPCFHLYHPSCILPWLSARNSCPLCRYELPTDDQDYEEKKHRRSNRLDIHEIQHQDMNEDVSSDNDGTEAESDLNMMEHEELENVNLVTQSPGTDSARRGWFFLTAAAPFVGIVGIVLVFCFGDPVRQRRWLSSHSDFTAVGQQPNHCSVPRNNDRRWWFLF